MGLWLTDIAIAEGHQQLLRSSASIRTLTAEPAGATASTCTTAAATSHW
jgi:hypothetical protein